MKEQRIDYYTIDELMALCLAQTIKEGNTVFNGVAVALPFAAIMLARKTHAPNCIFLGGLLAGLNPRPPFLPQTSGDSVMLQGAEMVMHLHNIFDMAMRGELDRIFFSGAQIDRYGNLNNTLIGDKERIQIKLPGGAGSSYIGCFARNYTIWSVRHDAAINQSGKKIYSMVDQVDFVTTLGHKTPEGTREELGVKGGGPDLVVTNLGTFDFDPETRGMRIKLLHPGVTLGQVQENTGFDLILPEKITETPAPTRDEVAIIRGIDPLESRKRGFSAEALTQRYDF
jgi:glutaconate CoA-transferase subunit B